MRIASVEATELFVGSASEPLQLVRVTVHGDGDAGPAQISVAGPAVSTPVPAQLDLAAGREQTADVGVRVAGPAAPGQSRPVTVIAEGPAGRAELAAAITVAEPGWTMWMVSHFHYDPVWWDTQGEFTESRLVLPDEQGRLPEVRTAFELVALHLAAARDDPDYKFVLAEIDYLKPYLDSHPGDRAVLRQLIADGRVEIVGGNYNEPNTNLTSAESTIRNAIYGLGYQRQVAGGDPQTAWMLDAFGFDPGYPGLMAAAGLSSSSWARGPYHQWGPQRTVGDNRRMQLRSEFEWLSPDGHGLLTSYMASHYGAGWATAQAADLDGAQREALAQFRALAPVAATRNVLLPVGADHVIPSRWATAIHRDWNRRYVWPRFVTALPREFFAAVRAEAAERGIWLVPQTRDMNPVYPGKDVTYIDTKQAQRAAETAVAEGERLATLAWLAGAGYPAESLDKAWRQLVFGAHHDAITGTESDQVYLDLLGGWREAWERGAAARRDAAGYLAGQADTTVPHATGASGLAALAVFNTLSWPRSGLVTAELEFPAPGPAGAGLRDQAGTQVPALAEGAQRHPDGSLARVTLTFRADGVPALGYRTYWVTATSGPAPGWVTQPGTVIENDCFRLAADPAQGGTLTQVTDRRTGTGLLRPGGNELVLQEEYDQHPRWGEGPWLLSPKGPGTGSASAAAKVTAQRCPLGARLLAELALGGLRVTQETLLWDGAQQVEFRTHVDGSIGHDRLLRVRFPADVPGGLPVYQTATTAVGRPFGSIGADVAEHAFTLDNPAHEWFGVGSTARVSWPGGGQCAIGVAEVILPAPAGRTDGSDIPNGRRAAITSLVSALAGAGVTATCSWPGGPRYGDLDLDSNLPDVRIALGGPADNPWTARLLDASPDAAAALSRQLASGDARVWLPATQSRAAAFAPGADVCGPRDLPVLVVAGPDLAAAVSRLAADLADSVIEVTPAGQAADPPLAARSVALLNRGTPGSLVTPDGTLHIALMRACSAWPSGVWIDGDRRTAPDGSSFSWQHWSHTFEYALAAGPGDWRDAGFAAAGQEYNHPLLAAPTGIHPGPLPATASLGAVSGPAMLTALKPRGNPLAAGRGGHPDRAGGVTARLRDLGRRAPGPARLSLFTGITAARQSTLTEDGDGPPVPVLRGGVPGGEAVAELGPAGTVTLALDCAGLAAGLPAGPASGQPGPELPEPVDPVFARYWLHGKGPAPAGNQPVAVHLSPTRVPLPGTGDPALVRLTVAAGPDGATGTVELDVPDGLVAGPGGPHRYQLPPLGYAEWELTVRGRPGAPAGLYFLAARIRDGLGQAHEDVAAVQLGPGAGAAAELDVTVLDITVLTPAATLPAGGAGELAVRLANRAVSAVRGEAQLIAPAGSWAAVHPWTRGFAISPGKEITLRYHVQVPVATRPGTQWWAMVKVMYFGRLVYTSSIPVVIGG